MRRRDSLPLTSELNLTNLIDIIFAILVVFMITAPLMSQGVKVDLPQAKASSLEEKQAINVTITKDREIHIGEEPSDLNGFEKDFRQVWSGDQETAIIINSDKSIPYGFVMEIVAAVHRQGGKRIGFLTDPTQRNR
ncbi:MAG: biopolymer transporter ExbD [Okeania sp. SIO1H5]|uniref:ExbD/TolR family protein n=1 Tax=Okeania sp. SIO1H5 TaxID=2607777 RepID=UPI0013BDF5E0|nr:biopolymer transporter ExbD [Okeania sp. SIO1H5]NET23571.1 biopolymer transporter ExbD [Okeania sp. SIO1H5]